MLQQKLALVALFLALGSISGQSAQAGLFRITDRTYGTATGNAAAMAEIDAVFNQLEAQVNANLPNAQVSTFLKGIADSAAMSGAGVGADYGTQFDLWMAGVGVGVGADLGGAKLGDLLNGKIKGNQVAGFGGQYSVLLGFRPGFLKSSGRYGSRGLDLSRAKFFANAMSSDFSSGSAKVQFSSFGLNGQYKLLPPEGSAPGVARWNGVDVTTGLRYSFMSLGITQDVTKTSTGTVGLPGNPTVTTSFVGTTRLDVSSSVWTIPVEVSTGGRLLHFLGLYSGLGLDLNFGKADGQARANAPVTATDSLGALGTLSGVANMDLGSSQGPSTMALRYFAGTNLEAGVVTLFVQYNAALTSDVIGVSAGLRAFW